MASVAQPQSEAIQKAEVKMQVLAIDGDPRQVLAEARKAARAIKQVLDGKEKQVTFNGKTYLQFEDWQTLGRFYGVTALATSTEYVSFGEDDYKVAGFQAKADALLVRSNQVISSAEAMCLSDELNWSRKPLFQLRSMAQTRACAKALRNVLAWVVVLAGYSPTPAEEMSEEGNGRIVESPRRKSQPHDDGGTLGFSQTKELFDLGKKHGKTPQQVMAIIGQHGFEQPAEIPPQLLDKIRAEVAA